MIDLLHEANKIEDERNVVAAPPAPRNIAPVLDLNGAAPGTGSSAGFTEGDPFVNLAPAAVLTDADAPASYGGAVLTVAIASGGQAGDVLEIAGADFYVDENILLYENGPIGNVAGGTDPGSPLTITFFSDVPPTIVQLLVRALAFTNLTDDPRDGDRSIGVTLTEADGTKSATVFATVHVTAVEDDPVAVDDQVGGVEAFVITGSVFADNGLGEDMDGDGPALQVGAVEGEPDNVGSPVTLPSGAIVTVFADGTFRYDPNGQFNSLAAPESGAVNTSAQDSFTYALAGGNTATVTVTLTGYAGNGDTLIGDEDFNVITGSGSADLFLVQQGGDDRIIAGGGDDGVYFGASFNGNDRVDGGAGTLDQLALQGNYAGLTLNANSVVGIENIVLLSGSDARFGDEANNRYSYTITAVDANVPRGGVLDITANTLLPGENLTFNGQAELDGSFRFYGGSGNDRLTGGQQSDGFFFGTGRFGTGDVVDGQGGFDQLALIGDYAGANAVTFGAGQMIGIENLVLLSANAATAPGYSYVITLNDANVAANASFAVSANQLGPGETLTLNAAAESNAAITVFAGAGADVLSLGALGDTVFGGGGADRITGNGGADQLTGGAGNDVFAYLLVSDSTRAAQDHILDFASGDRIDVSAVDGNSAPGVQQFTFIGSAPFTAAGQLHAVNVAGSDWLVEGDTDGNGTADFSILVTSDHAITAADFIGVNGGSSGTLLAPPTSADAAGKFGLYLTAHEAPPVMQAAEHGGVPSLPVAGDTLPVHEALF